MAQQAIPGRGLWIGPAATPGIGISPPSMTNSTAIAATGDQLYVAGQFWTKDHSNKTISGVGIRFGTVTIAGGSNLTLSIQSVDQTKGVPMQPTGTRVAQIAISNGSIVAGWWQSGSSITVTAVKPGDQIAVMVEYAGNRGGADSITLAGIGFVVAVPTCVQGHIVSAVTTAEANCPNVVFACDDGTFATLENAFVCSAINAVNFNNTTSTGSEQGFAFQLPGPCAVDAISLGQLEAGSTSSFYYNLYQGTTSLTTQPWQGVALGTNAARPTVLQIPSQQSITKNTAYYASCQPATSNGVTIYNFDVAASGHMQCHQGANIFSYATRIGGSWNTPDYAVRGWRGARLGPG